MPKELSEKAAETAEKIRQTFLERMDHLTPYKRSHLAIRFFRVSGNKGYNHYISTNFEEIREDLLEGMEHAENIDYVMKKAGKFFEELNPRGEKKGKERQRVFKDKKDKIFYFRMIELAHIWNDMGFIKGRDAETYRKWVDFLKKIDIKSMIMDDEVFRHYSAQLVTFVYQLKMNGAADIVDEFTDKFREVFMNNEELDDYMFQNRIYTLTHFIIGASNYYQTLLLEEDFKWILDYFRKSIDEILERAHSDIIAEVGLCFRLCGIHEGEEIDKITEYLLKEFDPKKGYIPRKLGTLNSSEHANSVAYMFLRGFDNLYPGPFVEE